MASTPRPPRSSIKGRKVMSYLAVAFLIALITLGGFLFFQNRHGQKNSNITDTNPPSSPSNQKPIDVEPGENLVDGQIFKIPELGIQIELPDGLAGLKYEMQDTSYQDETGKQVERSSPAFTTNELVGKDAGCSFGSIGVMLKVPQNTKAYGSDAKVNVADFSVILNRPQSGCSDNNEVGNLQADRINLLIEALNSATVIK